MAQFSVNAQRFDPYKNFKFRVKWDGRYVAGVSKVGALKRTTEAVEHREGGDPSTSASRPAAPSTRRSPWSAASPTTPSSRRGPTGSGTSARGSAPRCRSRTSARTSSSRSTTKAGQLALAYKVFRCWVSEFQALPDLDANANAVAIQTLKLENEGWERDYEVVEPDRAELSSTSSRPLSDPEILTLWEQGRDRHPIDRSLLLLGAAFPEEAFARLADMPIGRRDAALLELRCVTFGRELQARVACPACGERLDFVLDGRVLEVPAAGAGRLSPRASRSVCRRAATSPALPARPTCSAPCVWWRRHA
jgi:hypothetical protein